MEASTLQAPVAIGRLSVSATLLRLRSDEQLLAMFRAGSEEAFRAIHDRYRSRLFAYTRQMLAGSRQDAEDALQDVFVRAYSCLRGGNRPVSLRAWLYRVAHNRCIDQLRRPAASPSDLFEVSRLPLQDPPAETELREELRRLVIDVGRLPEQQRSALLMREMQGLSYEELSQALDVSAAAVKSLLVRARGGLVDAAAARDAACASVCRDLALAGDRGVRASGLVRRHLRDCAACREYRDHLRGARRRIAALVPVSPLGPLGVLAKWLGVGGSGAAVGSAGGATVAGSAGAVGAVTKIALACAAAAVTAGSALEVAHHRAVADHAIRVGRAGTPRDHARRTGLASPAAASVAGAGYLAPSHSASSGGVAVPATLAAASIRPPRAQVPQPTFITGQDGYYTTTVPSPASTDSSRAAGGANATAPVPTAVPGSPSGSSSGAPGTTTTGASTTGASGAGSPAGGGGSPGSAPAGPPPPGGGSPGSAGPSPGSSGPVSPSGTGSGGTPSGAGAGGTSTSPAGPTPVPGGSTPRSGQTSVS